MGSGKRSSVCHSLCLLLDVIEECCWKIKGEQHSTVEVYFWVATHMNPFAVFQSVSGRLHSNTHFLASRIASFMLWSRIGKWQRSWLCFSSALFPVGGLLSAVGCQQGCLSPAPPQAVSPPNIVPVSSAFYSTLSFPKEWVRDYACGTIKAYGVYSQNYLELEPDHPQQWRETFWSWQNLLEVTKYSSDSCHKSVVLCEWLQKGNITCDFKWLRQ